MPYAQITVTDRLDGRIVSIHRRTRLLETERLVNRLRLTYDGIRYSVEARILH